MSFPLFVIASAYFRAVVMESPVCAAKDLIFNSLCFRAAKTARSKAGFNCGIKKYVLLLAY